MATGATNQPVVCLFVCFLRFFVHFVFSFLVSCIFDCCSLLHFDCPFVYYISFFFCGLAFALSPFLHSFDRLFFLHLFFVVFCLYSKEGKETNYSNRSKCGWQPEDAHCVQHSHIPSSYHSPRKYLSLISKIFVSILLLKGDFKKCANSCVIAFIKHVTIWIFENAAHWLVQVLLTHQTNSYFYQIPDGDFPYPRFTWSYMRFYVEFGEISGNIPEY